MVSGHLGRDMELRSNPDGTLVGEISIGVNDFDGKDGNGAPKFWTTWVTGVIYGKRVQALQDELLKGRKVTITGQLRTRNYKISEEKVMPLTYVKVDQIEFEHARNQSSPQQQNSQ